MLHLEGVTVFFATRERLIECTALETGSIFVQFEAASADLLIAASHDTGTSLTT
jgi:hypothetical protein